MSNYDEERLIQELRIGRLDGYLVDEIARYIRRHGGSRLLEREFTLLASKLKAEIRHDYMMRVFGDIIKAELEHEFGRPERMRALGIVYPESVLSIEMRRDFYIDHYFVEVEDDSPSDPQYSYWLVFSSEPSARKYLVNLRTSESRHRGEMARVEAIEWVNSRPMEVLFSGNEAPAERIDLTHWVAFRIANLRR